MCGYCCIGFIDFVLVGKKLTDFTGLLSPHGFEKNDSIVLSCFKVNKIDKTNLTDRTKFRLNEITKTGNYFNQEINQRKSCIKRLSKYFTDFVYLDKV